MEKICFVVSQYGNEVNGGAEIHCKMLAERLTKYFDVDVLTSKIVNYRTFEEFYQTSQEVINNINVHRFSCIPHDAEKYENWRKRTKFSRKFRRFLFRIGCLRPLANIFPVWNLGIQKEHRLLETHGFYSPDLLSYLKKNQDGYKAIIFMSYPYPISIFGSLIAPHKSILIPTVHNEAEIFRSIQTHVFTSVKHIAFNTEEERDLTQNIFGNKMSENSIVAVGVETDSESSDEKELLAKFNLPEKYMHFFGRVCDSKMGKLIPWFIDYKSKNPSELKLVLTGRLFQERIDHPDILYTGFVTEQEKLALIKQATLVVNPSKNESLSLLLLEAMKLGKTALVNGRSEVMKGHCIKSGFAADYYLSKKDFEKKIEKYAFDENLLQDNKEKAKLYVDKYYNWDTIMSKLKNIIDSI